MWNKAAPALQDGPDEICIYDPIDDAYDAWRVADASARAVERDVDAAWLRHDRGFGAPPSRPLLRELAWLRQAAGEKLRYAIGLLHESGYIQPAGAAAARVKATSRR
jgi:hypothetical protein